MTTSTQWQLAKEAAERYQTVLTPTILGPFAQALVAFAAMKPGETVIDVGCGTGAAARYAAEMVGRSGKVTGIDINASMIDVARGLPKGEGAPIEWRVANAVDLPLADQTVDNVICAQTLQFLPEKRPCLAEMKRVVAKSGRVALSLWAPILENPYFHTLVESVARHIGPETAVGLQAAFALSNADEISDLLRESGFGEIEMEVTQLDLTLPELTGFVPRHIQATPMAAGFNQAPATAQQAVVQEVKEKLSAFGGNGRVQIPFRSHMILCKKQ